MLCFALLDALDASDEMTAWQTGSPVRRRVEADFALLQVFELVSALRQLLLSELVTLRFLAERFIGLTLLHAYLLHLLSSSMRICLRVESFLLDSHRTLIVRRSIG